MFNSSVIHIRLIFLSTFLFITNSITIIYDVVQTIRLKKLKTNLKQLELHNKTLELLYSNTRAFKHDFFNIVTALGGYINAKDMNGISNYYNKILDECDTTNNLSTLNPKIINNPAIYNIIASKYFKADELNIKFDIKVFINLNQLNMDVYDFSRILGILLDNAIEAAEKCKEKNIKIEIQDFKHKKCQILTIKNTYLDKNIDISKLSEYGYTSKVSDKEMHGIGLWQVSKIVKKYQNVLLDTSKDDKFFKQELAIYYK
jgi:two-component system sensor histidine kinase AgrC